MFSDSPFSHIDIDGTCMCKELRSYKKAAETLRTTVDSLDEVMETMFKHAMDDLATAVYGCQVTESFESESIAVYVNSVAQDNMTNGGKMVFYRQIMLAIQVMRTENLFSDNRPLTNSELIYLAAVVRDDKLQNIDYDIEDISGNVERMLRRALDD